MLVHVSMIDECSHYWLMNVHCIGLIKM